MSINTQLRMGMTQLIAIDQDMGMITRAIKRDNGRGTLIPTGDTVSHTIKCRVSYQSGGVWASKRWEGGLTCDTTPYVLAEYDADIERDDILVWRDEKYKVGVVTRPSVGGAAAVTQAALTKVENGGN